MIQTNILQSTHADLVTDAAYDFYGLRLATCSLDQRIKIWTLDETNGQWVNDSDWKAHDAPVTRLSWAHPEYGTILASCSFDKTVKIWEEGGSSSATYSTGAGEENTGSRWTARATLTESSGRGAGSVRAIEWACKWHGLKLAVLTSDNWLRIYECIELHNLATWTLSYDIDLSLTQSVPATPPMHGGDIGPSTSVPSSNGRSGTTGSSGIAGSRPGRREADGGWSVSWCKEAGWGQVLAVASGATGVIKILHLSDSRAHRVLRTLQHSLPTNDSAVPAVTTVSWAPNLGRKYHLIASGGRDGRVIVWKVTPPPENLALAHWNSGVNDGREWLADQVGVFDDHGSAVTRVEWNVTGTVLSSAGNDGNIRLWKATFGGEWKPLGHIHTEHGEEEGGEEMRA